jgi:CheY-like chemotaxis protein
MILLIVDDIPTNRKLLRVTLEAEGHLVLEAADGVEALAVLEREKVDAVISDILMPNMDGFRLCHEIRKNGHFRTLPFIIYTSTYTSPADTKLAQTVGADKYLTKPMPAQALMDALREAIAARAERPAEPAPAVGETFVLKQYSQALVNKLEEKNSELQQSLAALKRAHDRIVELNSDLERRVRERTAELEGANRELTRALTEVKELRGILPICGYCKKIRDDKQYWHGVEEYLTQRVDVRFSHSFCPECYEKHVKPELGDYLNAEADVAGNTDDQQRVEKS